MEGAHVLPGSLQMYSPSAKARRKKSRFLAQIEELILSMKLHKNHNMAFLSRILALG
jgi:hypothetical protein